MKLDKRILLIQAYQGREDRMGACFPIGLCYIATALEAKGCEVRIFDPNTSSEPYKDIEKQIIAFKPDVTGVSIRNIDTCDKRDIYYFFKTVQPTIELIKQTAPSAKIMVGGSGFSMFAEKIMNRIPQIDFGVFLEGEESVVELMEHLDQPALVKGLFYRHADKVSFSGPRGLPEFKKIGMPKRDFLDLSKYILPINNMGIQTKRGCPMKCAYCSYPFLNGNKIRLHSPEKVVDEIEHLVNAHGISKFMFVDGIFNIPKDHAREICEEILRRKLKVQWQAWFEINGFSEEIFVLAKKAGLRRLSFSPDAVSNQSLRQLKKGITNKDIQRVIKIIRRHEGVSVAFGFFGTPPGQTIGGVLNTIFLYLKINLFFGLKGSGGASISWIRIEPDTEIFRIAMEQGLITHETELLPLEEKDLANIYYSTPGLWFGDFLIRFQNYVTVKVLKPPIRLLKKVLSIVRPKVNSSIQ